MSAVVSLPVEDVRELLDASLVAVGRLTQENADRLDLAVETIKQEMFKQGVRP